MSSGEAIINKLMPPLRSAPMLRFGLLGLASFVMLTGSLNAADYFTDPLTGNLNSRWDDPRGNINPTPEGVEFTAVTEAERAFVRTKASSYHKQSFVAEVTLHIQGTGPLGIAFFGLGEGEPDPEKYFEPALGIIAGLKVCPTAFTQAIALREAEGEYSQQPGPGNGVHRARITWDATRKIALFELDSGWKGKQFRPRYRLLGEPVKETPASNSGRLYFGGGEGVKVSDFSVRAATPADIANIDSGTVSSNSDPSQNWLPTGDSVKPVNDKTLAPVDQFLANLNGQARLLACWYQGSKLTASPVFANGSLEANDTKWTSAVTATNGTDATDLEVKFTMTEGSATDAGVAVAFDFLKWNPENYVFAPAQLYNGNKFKIVPLKYPPYLNDPKDRPLDMPITTTNILHLNKDLGAGIVEMKTSNLSTPIMGFFDHKAKRGFLLLTDPKTPLGVSGMIVQEDPSEQLLSLIVNAPGVRAERYNGSGGRAPSGDTGTDWSSGSEVTLRFKLYNFAADDVPAFMAKVFDIRKALSGATTYRDLIPYSAVASLIGDHQEANKWLERGDVGYYVNRITNNPFHNQIGWGGNPTYSQPPAIQLTPERLRRIGLTWDMMVSMQGKTGLMHAMMNNGVTQGDTFQEGQAPDIAMVRRTGDVLHGGILQLETISAQGEKKAIKPAWEKMLRRCADGLVAIYKKYGQFGQTANVETGEMEVNGSTSGAPNIGALALASVYFKNPEYLKTAEAAGEMYYQRDLAKGYSGGGPAEILQSPDSESTWALAKSYMTLYDTTGNPKWLKYAGDAINLYATWVVSYDYEFPPESTLGKFGTKTTGSIFASSANNHSSPGTYVDSADFLLKYYRATGDPRYAEFYKDSVHNVMQYVNTESNRLQPNGGLGYVSERVQMSDWEGGNFGSVHDGDSNYAWECLAQLTSLQNPGIYLNTTTGTMLVLDHVKVEQVGRDSTGTKLKLTNSTPYDAEVKVLAETSAQAAKPLKETAFLDWPKVPVKAGETVNILVSPTGQVSKSRP